MAGGDPRALQGRSVFVMSEIARRSRDEVERYQPRLPSSWRELRRARDESYRAEIGIVDGARMTKTAIREGRSILEEAEDLGELGAMALSSFMYKALERRDRYMDGY